MDFVIAVDGPAASGKGVVAGRLAAAYALPCLDTGLLYRAVGHAAAASSGVGAEALGHAPIDTDGPAFRRAAITVARTLDPESVADPVLRSTGVGVLASKAAAIPEVRAALLDFQRRFAERSGGAVLDGRDIGTVIAPDAPCKLFVTAAPEVRAERRWKQLLAQGEGVTLPNVLEDIRLRDARDSGRSTAPLLQAPDAVLLDTSQMDISESVEAARRLVEAARGRWETSRSG